MPTLPIHNMEQRHYALTREVADAFTQAAHVCLDRHHRSPVDFSLSRNGSSSQVSVEWQQTNDRSRGAWEQNRATEDGAYACALAAVELSYGLVAFFRTETGSGADYYVGEPGSIPEDLEDCVRVEVSGVDHGPMSEVRARVRRKLKQAASGDSNLPAIAAVVGFKALLISMATLSDGHTGIGY